MSYQDLVRSTLGHLPDTVVSENKFCGRFAQILPGEQDGTKSEQYNFTARKILQHYFGICGHEKLTIEEIGQLLGLSVEATRQRWHRAVRLMRHPQRSIVFLNSWTESDGHTRITKPWHVGLSEKTVASLRKLESEDFLLRRNECLMITKVPVVIKWGRVQLRDLIKRDGSLSIESFNEIRAWLGLEPISLPLEQAGQERKTQNAIVMRSHNNDSLCTILPPVSPRAAHFPASIKTPESSLNGVLDAPEKTGLPLVVA